jgi:hypothetical protein
MNAKTSLAKKRSGLAQFLISSRKSFGSFDRCFGETHAIGGADCCGMAFAIL